jgi:hypothetical protein
VESQPKIVPISSNLKPNSKKPSDTKEGAWEKPIHEEIGVKKSLWTAL